MERNRLTNRQHSLRRVLPALAQEMASARRRATHLAIDNRRLVEQVRELRAQLESHEQGSRPPVRSDSTPRTASP